MPVEKDKNLRALMQYAGMFKVEKNFTTVFGGTFMIKQQDSLKRFNRKTFQRLDGF